MSTSLAIAGLALVPHLFTSSVVVAAAPSGELCAIDPATGDLLAEVPLGAIDVVRSGAGKGELVALVPAGDHDGDLVTLRFDGALHVRATLPFPAADGRLFAAGPAIVGAAFDEGATVFVGTKAGAPGVTSGWPASVLPRPSPPGTFEVLAIETDGGAPFFVRWTGDAGSLHRAAAPVDLGDATSVALVEYGSGVALVTAGGGELRAHVPTPPGTVVSAYPIAGDARIDAAAGRGATIAVLVGPAPELVVLEPHRARAIFLGAPPIAPAPWFSRRVAIDGRTGRVLVALDAHLFAVDVASGAVVPLPCGAMAVEVLPIFR